MTNSKSMVFFPINIAGERCSYLNVAVCPYPVCPFPDGCLMDRGNVEIVVKSEPADNQPEYEYIPLYSYTPIGFGVNDQIDFVFPFQLLQDGYHERWTDVKNVDYYLEDRKISLFICQPEPDEEGEGGKEFFTPSPARIPTSGPVGVLVKK